MDSSLAVVTVVVLHGRVVAAIIGLFVGHFAERCTEGLPAMTGESIDSFIHAKGFPTFCHDAGLYIQRVDQAGACNFLEEKQKVSVDQSKKMLPEQKQAQGRSHGVNSGTINTATTENTRHIRQHRRHLHLDNMELSMRSRPASLKA
jgi:hypothetical protein